MDRVAAICDLLVARGIRKRYGVNARVEIARRPDVLEKMERAGFSMLLLGIESAQDKTLRSMKKGFDTAKLRELFRVLGKSKMLLFGYFIVGNIGETEEEMLQIAPFARELGLDIIQLTMLRNERYSGSNSWSPRTPATTSRRTDSSTRTATRATTSAGSAAGSTASSTGRARSSGSPGRAWDGGPPPLRVLARRAGIPRGGGPGAPTAEEGAPGAQASGSTAATRLWLHRAALTKRTPREAAVPRLRGRSAAGQGSPAATRSTTAPQSPSNGRPW